MEIGVRMPVVFYNPPIYVKLPVKFETMDFKSHRINTGGMGHAKPGSHEFQRTTKLEFYVSNSGLTKVTIEGDSIADLDRLILKALEKGAASNMRLALEFDEPIDDSAVSNSKMPGSDSRYNL